MLHVHTAGSRNGYTLHVHTAVGGKEYTLHVHRHLLSIKLIGEIVTSKKKEHLWHN
jgi:hypothetical protein